MHTDLNYSCSTVPLSFQSHNFYASAVTLPNKICYFLWRTFIEEEFFRKWPGGAVYWYVLQLFRCGTVSMLMLVKALI